MSEDLNQNKNEIKISDAKKKELGILKVLSIVIPEKGKPLYKAITETGEIKTFKASELLD